MESKTAVKNDLAAELAAELDGLRFYEKIPINLIKTAQKNDLMIVFKKDDYSAYVYGAGARQNYFSDTAGELYFTENNVFTEPQCFEYKQCKFFLDQKPVAKKISFIYTASGWEVDESEIDGRFFRLYHDGVIQVTGVVFSREQLKHEYSDTELLNFLEYLNKRGGDKTSIKTVSLGWSLVNRRGKNAEGATSVRQAIIDFIRKGQHD